MSTQNCAECGTRAEPGQSFCDACGAVLSWDQGARAARPASPSEHAATPEPARTTAGAMDAARAERAARAAGRAAGPSTTSASGGSRGPASGPAEPEGLEGSGGSQVTGTRDAADGTGASGAAAATGAPAPAEATRRAGESDPPGRPGHSAQPDEPGGAGPAGTARTADGDGVTGPAPARPGTASPQDTPSPQDTAPTEPVPAAQNPAPHALSDTMSDRARSLLVPVADPQAPHPTQSAAAPVLPGRPDADRPAVRAPGQQPGIAGGPPCRWCSTPNRPDRHYCVRCAMPLAETGEAAAARRAPWWRRLFAGRRRETPWAGDRPRLRRVFDRIGTWITLAVVVTLAILGLVYLPDGVQATRDHFAKRAPVAPDRLAASRSYPGHKPELAFDKRSNTWWGPGVSASGQGEWIEATFSEPTRLLDLIITPGVSARAEKIGESALPHRVTATITGKDGKVTTRRLTLDQGAGGQRRQFRVGEVTKVRFTIESSHAVSADKQVAITEIEFFGPSNANR
ncbi:zinc ribbon domain-containing protein [Streptomyces sp. NPDC048272]|uniref:NADase-type glycan-binding domain-containing protein n=1 Tax=Streptomyces sp. NPDC048272 TaxID=3154616 RepID=UPI003422DEA0